MADLKINQLDPIIPVSSGSGATYSALADGDLFIVKMKVRGTAIGDEDRKLTWLELRNSLNLGQYMGTVGGNFTGDVTLSNNKALKGQQTGAGADIALIYVDNSNRVVVGNTTNLTRISSSSIPQFVDGTGTYNFLTTKNMPAPGDLSGGAAYTKAEVDNKLTTKFDKTGGDVSGDINLTQNASRLYGISTTGTKISLAYVTAGNTVNYGHSALHTNLVSTDVPSWTNGSQTYDLITKGNLPVPGDINAYTKTEVDTRLGNKLNLTGGNMLGSLFFNVGQGVGFQSNQGPYTNGMTPSDADLLVGDSTYFTLRFASLQNPTVKVGAGSTQYALYHEGNKPTAAALGLTDTVLKASTALQDGSFGIGTIPQHKADDGFLSINDATQFFVQDGSATEQRFGALGAGLHMVYGKIGAGTSAQYRSASLFISQDNKLISKWSSLDYTGAVTGTQTATYFSDMNLPTAAQVGAYSTAQSDSLYARKGVNADITALNALTGALKVGANATQPLEVTTLQQVQALTSGTAGAVVGVVGGFIGAVMWFNGSRSTIPAGWVPADGQQINRADYPDLWNAVKAGALVLASNTGADSDWISTRTARGAYSFGVGGTATAGTTFRVPDLNGKRRKNDTVDGSAFTGDDSVHALFLRGDGNDSSDNIGSGSGVIRPSAAPNITGSFNVSPDGANVAMMNNQSGAFKSVGSLIPVAQIPNGSGAANRTVTTDFDASRLNVAYGRDNATEVRPNSVQGIWIIRASNSFEAANTNFAVYNGSASAPANGTVVQGGALQSIYNIAGSQASSVSLAVSQTIGSPASAKLSVSSQGSYGGGSTKGYSYIFGSDGAFTAGSMWSNDSIRGTSVTATAGLFVTGGATVTGDTNAQRVLASWINSSGDTVVGLNNNTAAGTLYVHGQEYVLKTNQYKMANDANGYQTNGFRVANQGNSLVCDYQLYENRGSFHEASFHLYGAGSDNWFKMRNNGQLYWTSNRDGSFTMQYPTQSVQIASDGNVSGSAWGGWLRDYINARVSDRRTKENIQEITLEDAQKFVANAKTYQWDYKTNGTKGHGMIADEVDADKKFNTGSNKSLDLEDVEAIDEGQLALAYLTPVIADLMKQVAELKAQVAELKAANK